MMVQLCTLFSFRLARTHGRRRDARCTCLGLGTTSNAAAAVPKWPGCCWLQARGSAVSVCTNQQLPPTGICQPEFAHTRGRMTGWRHRPVHHITTCYRECPKWMRSYTEMAQNRLGEHCCSAQPCGHPQTPGCRCRSDGAKDSPCHSSRAHSNACRKARSLRASHAQPMQLCWMGTSTFARPGQGAPQKPQPLCERVNRGATACGSTHASRSDNLALRNTRVGRTDDTRQHAHATAHCPCQAVSTREAGVLTDTGVPSWCSQQAW